MWENINILKELKEAGAIALTHADNNNYYSVPEDYFTNLSSSVMANIFVRSLPSANPYTVSETYFTDLPKIILEKIDTGFFQHNVSRENVYSVPNGYFNSLAEKVLQKIKNQGSEVQQELEELSPLLSKVSKENVYTLPRDYFKQLNPLGANIQQQQPAGKVVSLGNKTRRWLNYAAAACISLVLLGDGYFFISGNKNKIESTPVATASKTDIQKELEELSDSEIEAYLNENGSMAVFTNVGMDDDQHQNIDIQTLIDNIPDEEIQQYLNKDEPAKTREGI